MAADLLGGSPGRLSPRDVVIRRGRVRRWVADWLRRVVVPRLTERYMLVMGGPVFFETLRTACALDLFGLLGRRPGLTLEEIAAELRLQAYPARVLLMSLTALRLLKKSGRRYRCAPFVARRLARDHPDSLVPVLEWIHAGIYRSMFHLTDAVKEARAAGLTVFPGDEDNVYQRLAHDPGLQRIFQENMQAVSRVTNVELLNRIDFSRFRRVLDVGGGNGENLVTVARRHADVHGTLFDFPPVAEMATRNFARHGLDGRLGAVGGNIFEDPFPAGHDCVLFCHFTPIFAEDTNRGLVRRAFAALEPGGAVCVYGPFMNDDETGPLQSALSSPYFLCTVNGKGRHYSWRETEAWLEATGFTSITRVRLTVAEGVVLGFKP